MKPINTIFSLILIVFFPFTAIAQSFTDREFTEKTYPVNVQTKIEVNNKYGKIQVYTWEKDSVKFVIDVNISSNNLSRLRKIKNSIRFDFNASKYYVTVKTDFGTTKNQIFTELRSLSKSLIPGKNAIEVNYRIYCPESVNLSLINKFGDIYIDDLRGKIDLSLSNGDMKINSISGDSQIDLNFGNAIINHLSNTKINISYSDLDIEQAEKVQITSKSSSIHINDIDLLKIESRRDKYFIKNVYSVMGNTNFSQIWIEKLIYDADLNLKFGELTADRISSGFNNLYIISDFADISLYIDNDAEYKADVYYKTTSYINFPQSEYDIGLTTINRTENEIHSFYSTSQKPDLPKLKIQALEKCFINITHR